MVNFASFSGGHVGLKVGGGRRRKVTRRRNSVVRKRGIGITRRIVERIGTMSRSVVLVVRVVAWIVGSRHTRSGKIIHTNSGSLLHHLLLRWYIIVHSLP